MVNVSRKVQELRGKLALVRTGGEAIALVPTMGALHEGHLSLVRLAKARCPRVVVSIFINPAQFGPGEDLSRYPRDEAKDLAKLAGAGCDFVWAPTVADVYPEGFATRIEAGGAAEGLESDFRPDHFGGVATVCCKLFGVVQPSIAVFGEKDYQQLCVIRRMVRDLNLPLDIVAGPTVREPDGLAMSSRNAYLSPKERRIAPALHAAIQSLAAAISRDIRDEAALIDRLRADTERRLIADGFARVDYVAVRDAETLAPIEPNSRRSLRVLAAAWLGGTRLIDNVAVPRPARADGS